MSEEKVSADEGAKKKKKSVLPTGCEVYSGHRGGHDYHPVLSVKRDANGQWWIVDTAAIHSTEVMDTFDSVNVPHPGDEYMAWWEIRVAWYQGPDYTTQDRNAEPKIVRELATNPFMALRSARRKLQGFRDGSRAVVGMSLPLTPLDVLPNPGGVTYSGETDGRSSWKVCRDGLDLSPVPSQAHHNYSLAGFRWGGVGPGANQLALALILDAVGDCPGILLLAPVFARDIVARMQGSWTMGRKEVLNWVAGHEVPEEGHDPASLII